MTLIDVLGPMTDELTISQEDPFGEDAARLTEELDTDLFERYPTASVHRAKPEELTGDCGAFLIGRVGGRAVACGAMRVLDRETVEFKRLYVRPGMRGRGISRLILKELESLAGGRGFRVLRAETGTRQPEAMRLCETSGYRRIECFGEYAGDPFSVCYERILE